MRFADQEIAELRDLTKSVAQETAGSTAKIEVFRGGEELIIDVILAKRDQAT